MTKPREFWIDAGPRREVLPDNITSEGLDFARAHQLEIYHVREVVPIDWEKVWKEFKWWQNQNKAFSGISDQEKIIQDLVERALKGEL